MKDAKVRYASGRVVACLDLPEAEIDRLIEAVRRGCIRIRPPGTPERAIERLLIEKEIRAMGL